MLEARGITVHYDDLVAVSDVDVTVGSGETLALLGRSGSGKTSLLRAIAGLVPLVSGSVLLGGTDLTSVPTHERGIGLVFQDFALFPHLDVGRNVSYGLRAAGIVDTETSVAAALDAVGLEGMERRSVDQLSGGQAQRVALARTLATRPKALLLDEPLGSLDPAYRRRVAGELSQLLRATAIPTVIVTHDAQEASALGDQIMVLDGGRSAVSGSPDAVWLSPGSTEAALMLGHTCVVEAHSTGTSLEVGDVSLPVAVAEGQATVLIRRATIVTDGGTPVTVAYSHFRGPGWVAGVQLGSAILEVEAPQRIAEGEKIQIGIDQQDIILL